MSDSSKQRRSRLFSGRPGLLLEELPEIVLPAPPPRGSSSASGYVDPAQHRKAAEPEPALRGDPRGDLHGDLHEDDPHEDEDAEITGEIPGSLTRSPARIQLSAPRTLGTPRIAGLPEAPARPAPSASFAADLSNDLRSDLQGDLRSAPHSDLHRDLHSHAEDAYEQGGFSHEGFSNRGFVDDSEALPSAPEPLRLIVGEGEASLVLAAPAPEDYADDLEGEEGDELYDEDESEEGDSLGGDDYLSEEIARKGIRLSLAVDPMEAIRNLEERRSFTAPIWGPDPDLHDEPIGYDKDINVFDQAEDEGGFDNRLLFDEEHAEEEIDASLGGEAADEEMIGWDAPDRDLEWADAPTGRNARIGDPTEAPDPPFRASEDEMPTHTGEEPLPVSAAARDPFPKLHLPPPPDARASAPRPVPLQRPAPSSGLGGLSTWAWVAAIIAFMMAVVWVVVKVQPPPEEETPVVQTEPAPDPLTPAPEPAVPDPAPVAAEERRLAEDMGQISVSSDRLAAVYIDGRKVGTTPLGPLDLKAGTYEVRVVSLQTGRDRKVMARVDAGKSIEIPLPFSGP